MLNENETEELETVEESNEPQSFSDALDSAIDNAIDEQEEATGSVVPESKPTNEEILSKTSESVVAEPQQVEQFQTPRSFSTEERQMFEALPTEAKTAVTRIMDAQQRHFTQATQEISRVRRSLSDVERVLTPELVSDLAVAGVTPGQYIESLFNADRLMRQAPKESIMRLMQANGLTPEDLLAQNGEPSDPKLESANQRLRQMEEFIASQQEQQRSYAVNTLASEIRAFAEEVDRDGRILRPEMQSFIAEPAFQVALQTERDQDPNASVREVLQRAYDWYLYRDPKRREQLKTTTALSIAEQKKQKALKAKNARSLVGSPTGPNGKRVGNLNIEEAIDYAMDLHGV